MFVRRHWLSCLSICCLLVAGCGSSEQPHQQSQAATPNDPQTKPNDPTDDDPSAEGESTPPDDQPPTTCTAEPVGMMKGWTKHVNGSFTFQAPSDWKLVSETAGYVEMQKKIAVAAGVHAYVRETAVAGTPDDGIGRIGDYPSDVATSGNECTIQSGVSAGTYACDPMANAQMVCHSARGGTMHVWWRFVYQGGHTFEVWCNVSNVADDGTCSALLDTLEIHM